MSDVELRSGAFVGNPYPVYRRWRNEAPIWWSDHLQGWVISRYEDVSRVLVDYRTFGQSYTSEAPMVDAFGHVPVAMMDPPHHTKVRSAINPDFRRRPIEEKMRAVVEQAVDETLATLPASGSFELKERYVRPIIRAAIAALMGTDDTDRLMQFYEQVMDYLKEGRVRAASPERIEAGRAAGRNLMAYLRELRARKEREPGPDLLSEFVRRGIDPDDIDVVSAQIVMAGEESPTRGIATTMCALLSHPDQLGQVRETPSLIEPAFEEALRWVSPVQIKGRRALKPTIVHGVEIEAGQELTALLGSANRDEEKYADPDSYQVGRRTVDHVAWGAGVHICVGVALARLEATVAIRKLLQKYPNLRLDPDHSVTFEGLVFRGPAEVWVRA
jgi:pulcherriminic acid synthase